MNTTLQVDAHCHVLPAMDDGARDCAESRRMLSLLAEQGIRQVVATPHFYAHRESAESFLARRTQALKALQESGEEILPIHPAAEVRLERGISAIDELKQMTWGKRNYLLLELPYSDYKSWMVEEIYNIAFRLNVVPVIAHLNRCLGWYSKAEMREILSIQEAVIQLNNEAFFQRKTLKFALELLKGHIPVILGSDAHNLSNRAPNFTQALAILTAKLKTDQLQTLYTFANNLLGDDIL